MILIADDNEENRILAKEIILSKNQKVKIIEASDGNEVVSLLFKKIPDILFIDLDMPNLNGIETTQHIRKIKGKLFDTMIAHYLINPDMRHNMDVLSETYLKYSPKSIEDLIGKKGKNQKSMRDVSLEEIKEFGFDDFILKPYKPMHLIKKLCE